LTQPYRPMAELLVSRPMADRGEAVKPDSASDLA
jgi:hypothetical protein